jgi:hypothetical protein
MVGIGMGVDDETKIGSVDTELSKPGQNLVVDVFGSSGIEQQRTISAAENRQVQWPQADLALQKIDITEERFNGSGRGGVLFRGSHVGKGKTDSYILIFLRQCKLNVRISARLE